MGKKKAFLFSTIEKGPYLLYKCNECEEKVVASKEDSFCPHCYSKLPSIGTNLKASIEASLGSKKPKLVCDTCESKIYSSSSMSNDDLINQMYCPSCGSAELSSCDTIDTEGKKDDDTEEIVVDESVKEDDSVEGKKDEEEIVEEDVETEDKEDDVEEEVQEKISSTSELEASLIQNPEPSWYFFKNGRPLFRILKSNVHSDARPLFETQQFLNIFDESSRRSSVEAAMKEFNAEVFENENTLNTLDLESIAFEKLQSHVIPKFQDCLALAVTGASKGVYPNLNKELKACFYDELVARGITETKVEEAIEAAFAGAGTNIFTALIAKATELMYKSDEAYSEIKATVVSAGFVKGKASITESDIETNEFRTKLKAGNYPLTGSTESVVAPKASDAIVKTVVSDYRNRLAFRKRS